MTRDLRPVLLIVAVAAVAVLAVLALRGTSVTIEELPAVDIGSPGDTVPGGTPIATVIGRRSASGGSFLWFRRGEDTYEVTVQFYAPATCVGRVAEGGTWPTADPACVSEGPIDTPLLYRKALPEFRALFEHRLGLGRYLTAPVKRFE